ncbi:MAG: WHG domain-containing protein [Ectothiorhodospiraceae bacterium]|nr:WHG domain-containing protein [Ectothiorhodospiraceae bacterium]
MSPQVSRREKIRLDTLREIRATARELLIAEGPAAVTINAIARRMGMSGPAIYRYYASHEELVEAVTADFYTELTTQMEAARDAHPTGAHRDRLLATSRAFRAWAVRHPPEFRWVFASPVPPRSQLRPESPLHMAGCRFGHVFLKQLAELWESTPFPVPDPADFPPAHKQQLEAYSLEIDGALPPEAVHVFITCWIRLYGLVCMEVLNQLDFACGDVEPLFEECLRELCAMLALEYTGPA